MLQRGEFDDGVGELTHGPDKGLDEAGIELRANAAREVRPFQRRSSQHAGYRFLPQRVSTNKVMLDANGLDARISYAIISSHRTSTSL